jgi:hypothetical protein
VRRFRASQFELWISGEYSCVRLNAECAVSEASFFGLRMRKNGISIGVAPVRVKVMPPLRYPPGHILPPVVHPQPEAAGAAENEALHTERSLRGPRTEPQLPAGDVL